MSISKVMFPIADKRGLYNTGLPTGLDLNLLVIFNRYLTHKLIIGFKIKSTGSLQYRTTFLIAGLLRVIFNCQLTHLKLMIGFKMEGTARGCRGSDVCLP